LPLARQVISLDWGTMLPLLNRHLGKSFSEWCDGIVWGEALGTPRSGPPHELGPDEGGLQVIALKSKVPFNAEQLSKALPQAQKHERHGKTFYTFSGGVFHTFYLASERVLVLADAVFDVQQQAVLAGGGPSFTGAPQALLKAARAAHVWRVRQRVVLMGEPPPDLADACLFEARWLQVNVGEVRLSDVGVYANAATARKIAKLVRDHPAEADENVEGLFLLLGPTTDVRLRRQLILEARASQDVTSQGAQLLTTRQYGRIGFDATWKHAR
jgi:hypothetical protein